MIWLVRAAAAIAIALLLSLAILSERGGSNAVVDATDPPPALATRTPFPTSTPEAIQSRVARTTGTPTPRPTSASARPLSVSIIDYGFTPYEIRVHVGDRVAWRNEGSEGHDVTGMGGEPWRSGPMAPSDVYERVFSTPGRFDYVCTMHPEMRGSVIVEP